MKFLAVLPSIYEPYTKRCVESMDVTFAANTLVVDNTVDNLGVAASWNMGAEHVIEARLDWLIVVSAATRFERGGLDFLEALVAHPKATAVEAAWGVGWHLIAFSRKTLEFVGYFDENFWPGYLEDMDYAHRVRLAGLAQEPPPFWPKVDVEAYVRCFAHSERYGGVRADPDALARYYEAKWGGLTGNERWEHPFGDETRDHTWWPKAPDPRALIRVS